MGLGNVAGHGQHEGNGVFAGCNGIRLRRIDYGNAFLGGFLYINAVDAHAGAADDFQVFSGVNDFLRDLGLASGNDGIIVADDFYQFLFLHIRLDIYDKFLFQDFFGFFSYVGSNENSEHNDFLL